MDKNINIDHKLIEYIFNHTSNLHPIQKELIKYNESLGHIKRLQISILQANFLQFLIKSRNIINCLEVGTFTGYSALSMALSLNKNGKILSIDKDKEKNMIAKSFFKKAKVLNKIKTEISNANVALDKLIKNNKKFDFNELIDNAIKKKYKIGVFPIDPSNWKDFGEMHHWNNVFEDK